METTIARPGHIVRSEEDILTPPGEYGESDVNVKEFCGLYNQLSQIIRMNSEMAIIEELSFALYY
ncbi:MAG: hypothetical protein WDO19_08715 [Bacteroidota bacterium]